MLKKILIAAFLLASLPSLAQSPHGPSVPFGPSGSAPTGATSVNWIPGQINCSSTTGAVSCGLPSTITEALTYYLAASTPAW